jgi:hypothetical protein
MKREAPGTAAGTPWWRQPKSRSKARELRYVGHFHDTTRYVELLADFIGDFPDITGEPNHPALNPDIALGYSQGQSFANRLRRDRHAGLIYPSVRAPEGNCFVAFEPSLVQNVRPGAKWDIVWDGSEHYSIRGV